ACSVGHTRGKGPAAVHDREHQLGVTQPDALYRGRVGGREVAAAAPPRATDLLDAVAPLRRRLAGLAAGAKARGDDPRPRVAPQQRKGHALLATDVGGLLEHDDHAVPAELGRRPGASFGGRRPEHRVTLIGAWFI